MTMRRLWSPEDEVLLRDVYSHVPNAELAIRFQRPAKAIGLKAHKMGLRKTPECVAKGQFKRGHETWNKGVPGSTGKHPNCRRNHFRKGHLSGQASDNLRPIGSELLDKDGVLMRKVSHTQCRRDDWRPVHVLIWEALHGSVPAGHIVIFADRNHRNFTPSNLILVTRAENMLRNSYLTIYPKDVADIIRMRGVLNRKINARSKA